MCSAVDFGFDFNDFCWIDFSKRDISPSILLKDDCYVCYNNDLAQF